MVSARSFAQALLLSGVISFGIIHSDSDAQDQGIRVLTSIKPIHSLVSGVLEGVGEAELLLDGASSPHTYSLKPSQASSLQDAEVIFWVGEELEVFLEKPLKTLGQNARIVALEDVPGLTRLPFREGGAFDAHEEHEEHEEHHKAEAEAHHADHDDHTAHEDHGEFDPHIWLDPVNAGLLVTHIASVLSEVDPDNAPQYNTNAEAIQEQMVQLNADLNGLLAQVRDRPFVVFHDGYHYFENRFGLQAAGSLTINPETMPGAARLSEIKQKLKELGATCVFSEPQFQTRIIDVAREGTNARAGVLDPLGFDLEKGPDLYDQLIRNMAASFWDCLAERS